MALNNKGGALIELGYWNDSLIWIQKAIKLCPERYEARVLYISILLLLGYFEKMLEKLKEILQLYPNDHATKKFIQKIEYITKTD